MACELVSALVSELVGSSLGLLEESVLSVDGSELELELELDCYESLSLLLCFFFLSSSSKSSSFDSLSEELHQTS